MSEKAIVLNQLTKHYGTHRGINDLSFSVNEGEFFGFIGPKGAGKATTIRTLMGLYFRPGLSDQGQCHCQRCGLPSQREQLL